jgi:uncharacterized protein (DUF1501 family)
MPQPQSFLNAVPAMTAAAGAGTNRRNIIAVFLAGGSCAHNAVFPRTGANRTHYTNLRPGIALADNPATAIDADWCFHPALTGMKTMWDAGRLAIVRNVGPLVQPVTRAQYLANSVPLPPQLYSHSDQQNVWETGIADQPVADTGWLGRLAELMIPFNAGSVSPLLSFAGPTDTFRAFDLRTLGLASVGLPDRNGGGAVAAGAMSIINNLIATHTDPDPLVQEWVDSNRRAVAATATVSAARDSIANPTGIPGTSALGNQMRMAIRLAAAQSTLNHRRTMFFVQHGGYDHHAAQLGAESERLTQLDPVLLAAYNATVALGISANTTFVVYSEFGRSLRQNGSGTDHGWGGHAFVFGGGVTGGWYGNPYSLDPAGPDIVLNQGHLIPTTSTDTLIASLGLWMGVPDATANGVNPLNLLCPNLPNFPTRTLAGMLA